MRQDGGLIFTPQCAKPCPMMHRMRITLLALVALLTLALVATGFGHRMPLRKMLSLKSSRRWADWPTSAPIWMATAYRMTIALFAI